MNWDEIGNLACVWPRMEDVLELKYVWWLFLTFCLWWRWVHLLSSQKWEALRSKSGIYASYWKYLLYILFVILMLSMQMFAMRYEIQFKVSNFDSVWSEKGFCVCAETDNVEKHTFSDTLTSIKSSKPLYLFISKMPSTCLLGYWITSILFW